MGRIRTIERDKLLDAAEAVTLEKGPVGLTIAAVAEHMGITNGGVQYSFRSKEALIAAMAERWQDEYNLRVGLTEGHEQDGHTLTRAHIEYAGCYDERSRRRGPSLMISVLNSPQHMELTRRWYRDRVDAIDASTDEGRRLRLAFLAMEGVFMMRLFGLIDVEGSEWEEIVADVIALCDGKLPRSESKQGLQAA